MAEFQCRFCLATFLSKNQLFRHLRESHGAPDSERAEAPKPFLGRPDRNVRPMLLGDPIRVSSPDMPRWDQSDLKN